MPHYVGIDLGTTNSVICSYDGEKTQLHKSPEQTEVTPSAIYFDSRGRYYGLRAYQMAAYKPEQTATVFKRFMGTKTTLHIASLNRDLTPEECSADILKIIYGYLPEDYRAEKNTGTMITVPAAFNQQQRESTLTAAQMAGIGNTALMQEPVAAVMSVMKSNRTEGSFIIFDIGGGTLDIALAQSISGHVNLLEHGGIEMCGGRDFDRNIVDEIIIPWMLEHFDIPKDIRTNTQYSVLYRLAALAAERAKINLSDHDTATINLAEDEVRLKDLKGKDIYLDINISRSQLDELIIPKLSDAVSAVTQVMERAHVTNNDIERIVFVGGPSRYKPLRDYISRQVSIPASTEIDPMTAVAEGAAIFAESVEWKSEKREKKQSHSSIVNKSTDIPIKVTYPARTPDAKARIVVQAKSDVSGLTLQLDNLDSGWSSGRMAIGSDTQITIVLPKQGLNRFKLFVFDPKGHAIQLPEDIISITRTFATVDAIPASYSVAVAAKERIGGPIKLDYLIRAGDPLPKKGKKTFKAEESVRAGSTSSIVIKLYAGEIETPYTDNKFIGMLKITGADFSEGTIPQGADLICDYEFSDAGTITMEVSVPCVSGTFGTGKNFYLPQEGQINLAEAAQQVHYDGDNVIERLDEIETIVKDPKLEKARDVLKQALNIAESESDPERVKESLDAVQDAKNLISQVRTERRKEIREIELKAPVEYFEKHLKEIAKPGEKEAFDNTVRAARRAITSNTNEFETLLGQIFTLNLQILYRQDWYAVDLFKRLIETPFLYSDKSKFEQLSAQGVLAIQSDNIAQLRVVIHDLYAIRIASGGADNELDVVNILGS